MLLIEWTRGLRRSWLEDSDEPITVRRMLVAALAPTFVAGRSPSCAAMQARIAVVFARGGSHLIGDKEFFRTPMWESPAGLLSVRNKRSLALATESGEDMMLRWNGRAWTIEAAAE